MLAAPHWTWASMVQTPGVGNVVASGYGVAGTIAVNTGAGVLTVTIAVVDCGTGTVLLVMVTVSDPPEFAVTETALPVTVEDAIVVFESDTLKLPL